MRQHQLVAGVGLVVGLLLLAFYMAPWRGALAPPGLPPELREEPDLFLEQAVIDQYRDDGALHYRLTARRALYFEGDHTRLLDPDLSLYNPPNPPWRVQAKHGRIKRRLNAGGVEESYVVLRNNVLVHQTDWNRPGFTTIRTSELHLYLEPQSAETNQDVMIETHTGQTIAGGLKADLRRKLLQLQSNADGPVQTVLPPELFGH